MIKSSIIVTNTNFTAGCFKIGRFKSNNQIPGPMDSGRSCPLGSILHLRPRKKPVDPA